MGLCELLGFDAMSLANEGTFLLAVKKDEAEKAVEILKSYNKNASIISKVTTLHVKKVIINSAWGTQRFLDMPSGELLPRIC